jgi:membrane fusion protein (multidrug efflux system)
MTTKKADKIPAPPQQGVPKNVLINKQRLWFIVCTLALLALWPMTRDYLFYAVTDDASIEGRHTMLAPKVAGIVTEVMFEDNDEVKKGQPLVRIDPRDYAHALSMTRAEKLGIEAHLKDSETKYKEAVNLFAAGAITGQQRDTAESLFLGLQAQSQRLRTQAQQNDLDLAYTVLVAPHDGRVGRRLAEPGMYAHAGQALVSFVAANERWVMANFKETQLKDTQVGRRAQISIDALGDHTFEGVVQSISPASGAIFSLLPPDNATGNYIKIVQRVPVKITFTHLSPSELNALQVGLNATVRIAVQH